MIEKYSARALLMAAALALLGAATLSSCARKPGTERAAAAPDRGAASAPPAATPAASPPPQAPIRISRQGAPASKPAAPLAASLRAFGLGVPSLPRIPEDFSLGPLQSYSPAEGDEAAVFAVARAFTEGIAAGKLNRELLLPEARDALSLLLAPPAAPAAPAEPASPAAALPGYRLGAIALRGEDASLRLRLAATKASAEGAEALREEGLLSLRKVDGAWYVEALALDPPKTGALAFAPDAADRAK